MKYEKNELLALTVTDMGADGEGIGKADGFTIFVKDALIGDVIEAKILKVKKNYAYARLEKVIKPSSFRITPECPVHRQCGGCQIQALSYEQQLIFKQKKLVNHLVRIGGFEEAFIDAVMEAIVGMERPFRYRNKAQYPVGTDKDGKIITGFYAGHTHTIISNTDCLLGVETNREILEAVLAYMKENHVSAYDEKNGQGLIRHILIRTGFTSGEIMVCLVVNLEIRGKKLDDTSVMKEKNKNTKKTTDQFLPSQNYLLEKLSAIPHMTSVSVNLNTEKTNVILGKKTYTIWGQDTISDTIHVRDMTKEDAPFTGQTLDFHISPQSFYQVNPVQVEKLYSLALQYASLTGEETVWDLYCGIGTISLFMSANARKVYGVEVIPQAIEDAKENAKRNGIQNAEFFTGKAEEILPAFYEKTGGGYETKEGEDGKHPDVIVVDPPRKGCDAVCLETMLKMKPGRIVYVSCDSATLARDLKILCKGGYELKKVRAVDMFPQTVGVETVTLLESVSK